MNFDYKGHHVEISEYWSDEKGISTHCWAAYIDGKHGPVGYTPDQAVQFSRNLIDKNPNGPKDPNSKSYYDYA